MQRSEELVSIIMPSYNTGTFISQSIESVINQTYQNWELIIVDDCSTDSTDEIVSRYLTDTRISYYKNPANKGAAYSRNRALEIAQGRWIAFLDSDDLWESEKLKKQVKFMLDNGYSFSYTEYAEIDETGCPLFRKISGPGRITKPGEYAYCWQGCLTVMYDRYVVGNIQIKDIKKNNDYAIWLKVCKKSDCYLLNEVLGYYRKRKNSISNHSYITLIKWHYYLWRNAEEKNVIMSVFYTLLNLVCGVYKKIRFVKTEKNTGEMV